MAKEQFYYWGKNVIKLWVLNSFMALITKKKYPNGKLDL